MKKKITSMMLSAVVLLSSLAFTTYAENNINVTRIAGSSRYDTAITVSKASYQTSEYAVIASGENFPDALVGGTLAGHLNAPLLISNSKTLDATLLEELNRLSVKNVYLLGGESALSKNIETELSKSFSVERLAGASRYETADKVFGKINPSNKYTASGRSFADALSATPLIVKNKSALILSDGNFSIDSGVIVGGTNSVPGQAERIAGSNRFATAVEVAKRYNANDTVILVDGANYPDALSASTIAKVKDAPILLTNANTLSAETKAFLDANKNITNVIIVGGNNSVSENVVNQIIDKKVVADTNAHVVKVVDGDTILVDFNGTQEKVRLIGIDTPESVHPDQSRNVPEGKVASDFTKNALTDKDVKLVFDVQERDKYGRLLAYVFVDGVMFNKTLLSAGMAKVATYPPNVAHVDEFKALQDEAKANQVGFWKDYFLSTFEKPSETNNDNTNTPSTQYHDGLTESPYPDRLIKGNINSKGEKIYHMPGQRDYKKTVIDESKGERWFATEAEAKAAGWRKALR